MSQHSDAKGIFRLDGYEMEVLFEAMVSPVGTVDISLPQLRPLIEWQNVGRHVHDLEKQLYLWWRVASRVADVPGRWFYDKVLEGAIREMDRYSPANRVEECHIQYLSSIIYWIFSGGTNATSRDDREPPSWPCKDVHKNDFAKPNDTLKAGILALARAESLNTRGCTKAELRAALAEARTLLNGQNLSSDIVLRYERLRARAK